MQEGVHLVLESLINVTLGKKLGSLKILALASMQVLISITVPLTSIEENVLSLLKLKYLYIGRTISHNTHSTEDQIRHEVRSVKSNNSLLKRFCRKVNLYILFNYFFYFLVRKHVGVRQLAGVYAIGQMLPIGVNCLRFLNASC